MKRYLMYLSYIGTRFRSVQKEVVKTDPSILDPNSVQGLLEIALKRFHVANEPRVYISSRTDQGVHAIQSAIHVDLERLNGSDFDPHYLTFGLNHYFEKSNVDLRIQSCQIVPETFHARHSAQSRTYLYRLAVRKPDAPELPKKGSLYLSQIPFAEWKRCHFIQRPEFDISLLMAATTLFPGKQDFRTFMGCGGVKGHASIRTTRLMHSLDVTPGSPMLSVQYDPSYSFYRFWDITCHAQSFLYRQVRRIVGALLAVGLGHLSKADIQYMLDHPSPDSWNPRAVTAPAYGLYLLNVEYAPQDLQVPNTSLITCI